MDLIKAGERLDFFTIADIKNKINNMLHASVVSNELLGIEGTGLGTFTQDLDYNNLEDSTVVLPVIENKRFYLSFLAFRDNAISDNYFSDTLNVSYKGVSYTINSVFHAQIPISDKMITTSDGDDGIEDLNTFNLEIVSFGILYPSMTLIGCTLQKNSAFGNNIRSNVISVVNHEYSYISNMLNISGDFKETKLKKMMLSSYNDIKKSTFRIRYSNDRADIYTYTDFTAYKKDKGEDVMSIFEIVGDVDLSNYDYYIVRSNYSGNIFQDDLSASILDFNGIKYVRTLGVNIETLGGYSIVFGDSTGTNDDKILPLSFLNSLKNNNDVFRYVPKSTTVLRFFKGGTDFIKGYINQRLINNMIMYHKQKARNFGLSTYDYTNYRLIFALATSGFSSNFGTSLMSELDRQGSLKYYGAYSYLANLDFDNMIVSQPSTISNEVAIIMLNILFPDIFKPIFSVKESVAMEDR